MKICGQIKIIVGLLLIVAFLYPGLTKAFTITPASFKYTIDPGGTQIIRLKVKNNEAQEASFKLKVLGSRQDRSGLPLFGTGFDEAEGWTAPQTGIFILKPNKERQATFVINVPKTALAGGHYLGVGVEKIGSWGGAISLTGQLLAVLSLQVAGTATENLQITEWTSASKIFLGKNWKFNLALLNRSNIEVPLSGAAVIKGWPAFAKASAGEGWIAQIPLDLGPTVFLPGSSRVLKTPLSLTQSNLIWPGRYLVQAEIHYGRTNQTALVQATVWYVPWWTLIGGLLIIGLAVWWRWKRKIK